MSKVLDIKSPDYFHRDYKNDLPNQDNKNNILNQAQRVGLVALPFISLYKPFGKTLAIGTGASRTLSCSIELLSAIKAGDSYKIGKSTLNTALAISSIAGTILLHPLGMLITTGHDLTLNGYRLVQAITSGNKDKITQETMQFANNIFYLLTMTHGGLEYQVLSLVCQVIISSYSSLKEFKEGNYLESAGYALMTAIRINQTIPQVSALQKKWELDALLRKIQHQESVTFNKNIPVLCAVGAGSLPVVSALVSTNKSSSVSSKKNESINHELSQALVKYGNNDYGIPALHAAIRANDFQAVKLFLDNEASPNSLSRSDNFSNYHLPLTALDYAAAFGDEKIINILIDRGAKVNPSPIIAPDNDKLARYSPLHFAARFNNSNAANLLIKRGALPYYLCENMYNYTPIHIAAMHGAVDVLNVFKKYKVDFDFMNKNGWPPIYDALMEYREGSLAGVKFLLEEGVKLNFSLPGAMQENLFSCITPFWSIDKSRNEKFALLLKYGANPNLKSKGIGYNALHSAVAGQQYEMVKSLLGGNYIDDINDVSLNNKTPLDCLSGAQGNDTEKIYNLLRLHGAKHWHELKD